MLQELESYDWQEAFRFGGNVSAALIGNDISTSGFNVGDVQRIVWMDEGQNDGDPWLALGELKDGRWFFLSAWCDYTGWDCQAGGSASVAKTFDDILAFGPNPSELFRLCGTESLSEAKAMTNL